MTQIKCKIKKGDVVVVTTGKNKGKTGLVQKVILAESRLLVDGINVVRRNKKPTAQNPDGPVTKNLPIHISNVSLFDPETDQISKVGYKISESGQKVRFLRKTGTEL
ncbi:MAG: 50S ribosomal protein L24 [Alphaproteobacteria bacterium]|nr:50S ribosomal protein L24 [Alphaproteobacteria bacterium]